MPTWNYIVILLSFLLLAYSAWNEWQRVSRKRLALRLLASVVAIVCFACLALPLTRNVKEEALVKKQAVLLTEGFNEDSVNVFLAKNKNHVVYTLDKKLSTVYRKLNPQVITIDELAAPATEAGFVHVFGYGLSQEELKLMPSAQIRFHAATLPTGFISASWQKKIQTGKPLRLQGKFLNTTGKKTTIVLSGYGTNLDTAIVEANQTGDFELISVPKQFGKAVFSLLALNGKDTVSKEPVPFETEAGEKSKILILAGSPDFENKFLRTWLSQNNYSLVSRTTISKNKYEKTFLNSPQIAFSNITSSFLNNFDVLIADVNELNSISRGELAAIESQVATKGMGLVIKTDSAEASNAFYSRPFPVLQNPDKNQKQLNLFIPVSNQYASGLTVDQEIFIRPKGGTRSLIEDKQSNTVVGSTVYGTGRLVYTTVNTTYSWMLSGDEKNYTAYWSYLLEQATPKTTVGAGWGIAPAFPFANNPVDLIYTSDNSAVPRIQVGQDFVHLSQNPDLPFQWRGTYWPAKSGWQPILQEEGSSYWWYAYNSADWNTLNNALKREATLEAATAAMESSPDTQEQLITVPLSKIYFLILFFCSVGFLWLEKKL